MTIIGMSPFDVSLPDGCIRHHFAGVSDAKGVYAKECLIPADYRIRSHRHVYDHLSILASGKVILQLAGELPVLLEGPATVTIPKGRHHTVMALTDAVWFCIHPTDNDDPWATDEALVEKDSH